MIDSILIQDGRAHQIWRGVAKADLPPLHPDLVAQIVEAAANTVNEGYIFNDDLQFVAPPPQPAIIPYSAFRAQWTDAEKAALHAACVSSWQIDDFVGLARAQGNINLTSSAGLAAKAALVAASVLTQERADALFNPETYR